MSQPVWKQRFVARAIGARPAVQEAMRAECRLVFRTAEESKLSRPGAQVPIEIAAGHPAVLQGITFPDDYERILLIGRYRSLLEKARDGASGLVNLRDELRLLPEPDRWTPASVSDLELVANWAAALLRALDQNDPLEKVLSVREDVLGVYYYEARYLFDEEYTVNPAKIRLYGA